MLLIEEILQFISTYFSLIVAFNIIISIIFIIVFIKSKGKEYNNLL